MNIKTFRADSLQEGLERVRKEFGDHARIMHTREIDQRRLFGLWKRRIVEITASEGAASEKPAEPERFEDVLAERFSVNADSVLRDRRGSKADRSEMPPCPIRLGAWRQLTAEQLNPTLLQRNLIAKFQDFVRFAGPFDLDSGGCRVVAFLGSTGVGKTSTIAKIAAHYKVREFKKVGLLTMDVFRIAAAEQLQKYAEMLDVPCETVSEPGRIRSSLRNMESCDLVLLDMPGTNPKNHAKLQMLRVALEAGEPDDVQLLLPATGSTAVLFDSLRRFDVLRPTSLTLTKWDEAVGLNDMYHFLKENDLPLRFLTMGQNVSEDIEVAGPARLASLA